MIHHIPYFRWKWFCTKKHLYAERAATLSKVVDRLKAFARVYERICFALTRDEGSNDVLRLDVCLYSETDRVAIYVKRYVCMRYLYEITPSQHLLNGLLVLYLLKFLSWNMITSLPYDVILIHCLRYLGAIEMFYADITLSL